jgi:hypothetical protein
MNARFEAEFEEIFKPVNAAELQTLKDMEQGERDCRDGVPHKEGMSEAYSLGYSYQYAAEAREDAS